MIACQKKEQPHLTIATAANMQFAMKTLIEKFTQTTGVACDLITNSSGKLTAQIKAGAPYDIFIAANMRYPDEVFKAGLGINKPVVYAYGKLVLWTMNDTLQPNVLNLRNAAIKHIAIANPKVAPYGKATVEALMEYGIYEDIKDKLVFGESVLQANQFIVSQSASIGFTSKSVVMSPNLKGKGHWVEVPNDVYKPIEQGIVLLKNEDDKVTLMKEFYEYLFSIEGQKILRAYGYVPVN